MENLDVLSVVSGGLEVLQVYGSSGVNGGVGGISGSFGCGGDFGDLLMLCGSLEGLWWFWGTGMMCG